MKVSYNHRFFPTMILLLVTLVFIVIGIASADYDKRVICGRDSGGPYTDVYGYRWEQDQAYIPGDFGFTKPGTIGVYYGGVIENTVNWIPYRYERWNDPEYQFDVPGPGTYYVKLLYAEKWFGLPLDAGFGGGGVGSRVFDVLINDTMVQQDFDILLDTGERGARAVVMTYPVVIPSGGPYAIKITIASADQGGKLDAIEIADHPTLTAVMDNYRPASMTHEEVYRLNCGGGQVLDSQQQLWMPDEPFAMVQRWGFAGGREAVKPSYDINLLGVLDTWRAGDDQMSYRLHIPNGRYQVVLLFSEHEAQSPGQRVFDVLVNGQTVGNQLDIFKEAGAATLLEKETTLTVSDEKVDIRFANITAGEAMINGIELHVLDVTDNDFLDFVEKRSLDYFRMTDGPFATVNANNGLTLDRQHNFFGDHQWGAASIAATGFALAAICAGAERGWLDKAQVEQQAATTITYFNSASDYQDETQDEVTQKEGFFFHFLDMNTGKRVSTCELSSIDSTLLFAGMLAAADYFKNTALDSQAQALLQRANWTWFAQSSSLGFCAMAWRPESGAFESQWSRYNEGVLLNIIGMGASNNALSTAAWYYMDRYWVKAEGFDYMIEDPVEPTPMFTHLYPQCYLRLSNLQDDKNNYFKNNALVVDVDKAYCQSHSDQTYQAGGWGLTASDSPKKVYSYAVYRTKDGENDGTVNPCMVAGAIPFAPQQTIADLRRLYFDYKHFIWGRFGFSNSYNLDAPKLVSDEKSGVGWVAADIIGIDQGALVAGIENYRTGFVWDHFMAQPSVKQGMARVGMGSLLIDDFDNDGFYQDQPLSRDANWWSTAPSQCSLSVVTDQPGNSTACLKIDYIFQTGQTGLDFGMANLSQPANMSYFQDQSSLTFAFKGTVTMQLRFEDKKGQVSSWSSPFSLSSDQWQEENWDYNNLNWLNCDNKQIEKITFHIISVPNNANPGIFYLDSIRLGGSAVPVIVTSEILDKLKSDDVLLYPNPAGREVSFSFNRQQAQLVQIDIYNMAGERIAQVSGQTQPIAGDHQKIVWLVQQAAPGLYLCRVQWSGLNGEEKARAVKKLVIVK